MNKPIDIFMCAYMRPTFTEQSIIYLRERTKHPYRLFLINNGGNKLVSEVYRNEIFMTINLSKNAGVTAAWQIAQALAESEYFITTDNDIYVPDLDSFSFLPNRSATENAILSEADEWEHGGDWLERMVRFMDDDSKWGAISLHPHVFIGAVGIDPNDPEDVKDRNMCGAVMRIIRRDAVRKVNGWADEDDAPLIRGDRGHEERTICSRLQNAGYKTGIASRIRAYHPFGKGIGGNWGYPENITPEMQGHNPALKEEVLRFDNQDAYDPKTWLPK